MLWSGFQARHSTERLPLNLRDWNKKALVSVIDLVFVLKDEKGNVLITEAKNLGGVVGDAFSAFAETSKWFWNR